MEKKARKKYRRVYLPAETWAKLDLFAGNRGQRGEHLAAEILQIIMDQQKIDPYIVQKGVR